jgi:succinate dehydrogenase / fumarate reductase iron-sulfur subunit
VIYVEPWRSKVFPVVRDLIVDRSALDRLLQAYGFISVNTGSAPDGNAVLINKETVKLAMDAAQCIGCGACVAACPNSSAALFAGSKISHLALLPQGQPEREQRVLAMTEQADKEGFGSCTNIGECQEACPKEISIRFIGKMNREYLQACFFGLRNQHGWVKAQ